MAANTGRLTDTPGVCFATLGPGATNLLTGVSYAQLGRMPMVAVTGQKPLRDNWQGRFQIVDIAETFRHHTQAAVRVVDPERIATDTADVLRAARSGRRGAAVLELPQDVARATVSTRPARLSSPMPAPSREALEHARSLIDEAKRPLIVLGSGANRSDVASSIPPFVEQTGLHALATQMGKGALPEDHAQCVGWLGVNSRDYIHAAIDAADVLLTIGYDTAEYPPSLWRAQDKNIVHLDTAPAALEPGYRPSVEIVGDVSESLRLLAQKLSPRARDSELVRFRQQLDERIRAEDHEMRVPPLGPRAIIAAIRAALEREDIVALDNGLYKIFFARAYQALAPHTLLLDNALATMGAGLATAMAAALVHPRRKVVAVCGDGGLMMNLQALETLARLALDVVVVVLRDDAYGFIRYKQRQDGYQDHAMDFGNPSFCRVAEAFGIPGLSVGAERDFPGVMREALSTNGPTLVECPFRYPDDPPFVRDLDREIEALA